MEYLDSDKLGKGTFRFIPLNNPIFPKSLQKKFWKMKTDNEREQFETMLCRRDLTLDLLGDKTRLN